jgi:hypothetical protein
MDEWIADWMPRPGANSKQALVYRRSDPTVTTWCEHRHRKVGAAVKCAQGIIVQLPVRPSGSAFDQGPMQQWRRLHLHR